jgi:predicted ATPase
LVEKQLEQLSEEEQQVLGAASVVGVEFSAAAVAAGLEQKGEQVEEWCEGIARRHLFLHSPERYAGPERRQAARYRFLHAVYQSVVAERLTPARRRQLHRRVGEWKAGVYGKRAREIAAELAVHFERGQDYGRAVQYYRQAAQNALQRSAPREAIDHLTKGLELLQALPDTPERRQQELTLQLTLGAPLVMTKGYAAPEVERTFARARELCQQIGGDVQFPSVLWGLWMFYLVRAELQSVQELGEQGLTLAQRGQDSTLFVLSHNILGLTRFFQGAFAPARAHLEQSQALFDPQKHLLDRSYIDPELSGLLYTAQIVWYQGYPDQALQRIHQALSLAHKLASPHSLAFALNFAATVRYLRGESLAAREQAEAAIALCGEHGFLLWLAHGMILRGWALTRQGQAKEGSAQILQGLATWQAIGAELARTFFLALLAETYEHEGQAEEGLRVVAEALTQMDHTGERFYEAELYRLKGQLTLQRGSVASRQPAVPTPPSLTPNTQHLPPSAQADAEACFMTAIDIARRQKAKSLELRATTSLARLLHRQGRNEEARQRLAQIYGWFTEGFDTADLQEAKVLLEEIGVAS